MPSQLFIWTIKVNLNFFIYEKIAFILCLFHFFLFYCCESKYWKIDFLAYARAIKKEPLQAPWINWVIRMTWPHLLKDQAATGAVWREKLTMLLAVMVLLWPSRLQSLSWYPVETSAAPFMELSGIEPLSEILVSIT